jgi:Bacterial Ig domain
VGNDGGWCAITVNNNGWPFDAGLAVTPPAHGKLAIHTVGNDTRIDYTPTARFAGADTFSVRLIPGDATVRATATVTP